MANVLMEDLEPSTLSIFLIVLKGTDIRFKTETLKLLERYQDVFGQRMWQNVVVEMSFWGHKKDHHCARKNNNDGLDEREQTRRVQKKVI